jgi:hypothetical protein
MQTYKYYLKEGDRLSHAINDVLYVYLPDYSFFYD